MAKTAVIVFALTAPQRASAGSVAEFYGYSAVTQANWLLGFHEGFVKSGLETDDIEPRKRIGQCLQGLKTAMHLLTAFKVWISAHPEMMTKDVPRAYLQYLFDVCPDAKSVGR